MAPDRGVRTYHDAFLGIGFTSIVDKGVVKPQCVICARVLSAASIKRNHLQRHFTTEHSQLLDKDRAFLKRKLEALNARKLDVTGGVSRGNAALVEASFMIAFRIAKTKKAHTIAEELIMPCIKDVVRLGIGQDQARKLSAVSVSDNTIYNAVSSISLNISKLVS